MSPVRLGAFAGTILIVGACSGAVHASDWGCQVLLCLSNPGGPTQYSACVPPITKLYETLAMGGGFPSCSEGGMSNSKMGMQLYRCNAGWVLKKSSSPFGGNVCQSLTETRHICTNEAYGHNGATHEVCSDVPVEKEAERNPTPNYVDVRYPDGKGGTTTQRIWFSLKD